jgi:hypothetical protein
MIAVLTRIARRHLLGLSLWLPYFHRKDSAYRSREGACCSAGFQSRVCPLWVRIDRCGRSHTTANVRFAPESRLHLGFNPAASSWRTQPLRPASVRNRVSARNPGGVHGEPTGAAFSLNGAVDHNTIRKRPPTGGLFLLVSTSFYEPYRPATGFNAGVVPPLADSLRAAM